MTHAFPLEARVGTRVFTFGAALCLATFSISAQSQLPVPEYYGIYAALNGKLLKLDGRELRAEKTIPVKIGQRQPVSTILSGGAVAISQPVPVPLFPADLKIIVYQEARSFASPLLHAKQISIEPLVFIRNVSVDTGYPNNVRRSGPENGWEYGNAPEMLGVATGDHPEALEVLWKPMPGHPDIVIGGFAEDLRPGVYRLNLERREEIAIPGQGGAFFTFGVDPLKEAESAKCMDATVTYAMAVSNVKYRPCGGTTTGGAVGAPSSSSPPPAGCADYDACMDAGNEAVKRSDWDTALASFKKAASDDKDGSAWFAIGDASLAVDPDAVAAAWDKALALGASLPIRVCRGSTFKGCDSGTLRVSSKAVALLIWDKDVWSVAPSVVTASARRASGYWSVDLQVGGKKYSVDPLPRGVECNFGMHAACGPDGMGQQKIVADYVVRTIPKLGGGGQP